MENKELNKEVDKIVNQLAGANIKELPDAYMHQKISFIKSGVRILGYCFIIRVFYFLSFFQKMSQLALHRFWGLFDIFKNVFLRVSYLNENSFILHWTCLIFIKLLNCCDSIF